MSYFEEQKQKIWFAAEANENQNKSIEEWAKQTYQKIKDNVQDMAAFVTVLNHKCWFLYEDDEETSKIYADLYYKYNALEWEWLEEQGTAEEKKWYFDIMD